MVVHMAVVLKKYYKKRIENRKKFSNNIFWQLIFYEFTKIQMYHEKPAPQMYLHVCIEAIDKSTTKMS